MSEKSKQVVSDELRDVIQEESAATDSTKFQEESKQVKREAEGKMSEKSKQVVIGELRDFIQEESAAAGSPEIRLGWDNPIFRVPIDLLGGHEKYYIPKTVSIGPFHARDSSLSSADEQKRADLKRFLSSFPQGTTVEQLMQELTKLEEKSVGDPKDQQLAAFFKRFVSRFLRGTTVEQLVQEMKKSEAIADLGRKDKGSLSFADEGKKNCLRAFIDSHLSSDKSVEEHIIPFLVDREQDARNHYEGQISLSSSEFLKMMLLDGCFIVDFLLGAQAMKVLDEEEHIVMAGSGRFPIWYNYQQDLLKLENQMPFFILSHLYDLVDTKRKRQMTLVGSAISLFQISMPKGHRLSEPNIPLGEIKHLLHLVRMALFPSSSTKNEVRLDMPKNNTSSSILAKKMGASELESSYGIVFTKRENVSLPDIKFKNGVLSIPELVYEESSTPPLFFNLLASRLSSEEITKGVFTSYVIFMDGLISNEKDVEVLLQSEILKTRTNDVKGLVNFFNALAVNAFTTKKEFHFEGILEEVNKYCYSGLRPLRAYLVNNYYESRWEVLSSFLLFFLTVTQTLFSILSYSPQNMRK